MEGPKVIVHRDLGDETDYVLPREPKKKETILEEAGHLVDGARNDDYGNPFDDFDRVAKLWRAYLSAKGCGVVSIGPRDVALMMVLLKVAREVNKPKRDTRVDIAGYAQCLDMVDVEERRREPLRRTSERIK